MMEQNIKVGDMIEIVLRKCSDKVQGNISVGSRYKVQEIGSVKSGATKLLLSDPQDEKRTCSVNGDRFEWIKYTKEKSQSEQLRLPALGSEEYFKMKVKEETKMIIENFSFQEHVQIAFIPLVIAQAALIYVDKVLKYAAEKRMSIFVKLSRATKMVRDKYNAELAKDLSRDQITRYREQTEQWLSECQMDFTIFYFTIDRELKRINPNYTEEQMRTYAILAMIILDEWNLQNEKITKMIADKLGHADLVRNPLLDSLRTSMDAYAGEISDFNFDNQDIKICRIIFRKNLNKIEFGLEEDECTPTQVL